MLDTNLIYTSEESMSWFYNRYFYGGGNQRYYTFQLALNLLNQTTKDPVIIETGCQRQEEDVGAGMSTSIFAEYISRYDGSLITIDNYEPHLRIAMQCCRHWPDINIDFIQSDSVKFLQSYKGKCDFIYLDSLDYPIGNDAHNKQMQDAAQKHCLNEFLAIEKNLNKKSIVLLDDNTLPGGGKPKLVKDYLQSKEWLCLIDLQSSLWIKNIKVVK